MMRELFHKWLLKRMIRAHRRREERMRLLEQECYDQLSSFNRKENQK